MLDFIDLSRIQFAFTMSFHILFPAFSIGLSLFLLVMEAFWLKTQEQIYYKICRFWTKVFALTFGMGIVSGIVMEFQLGTNWSQYALATGPVLGGLFTYEVMTAFFIEAGFLGIVLFGWNRVTPRAHFIALCCVAFGVTLSAFWIMAANSWMQTPDGAHLLSGQFVVDNWYKVIFNHSTIVRFLHMLTSCWIATLMVVLGVSCYYLKHNLHIEFATKCLKFAVIMLAILAPSQIIIGDLVGIKVHKHQPIKTAAIEGLWETTQGAPLILFAIPDQNNSKNNFEIKIDKLASFINTHDWNGTLQGLNSVSNNKQPNVGVVFFSFRVMVAIGLLILAIAYYGLYIIKYCKAEKRPLFLNAAIISAPLGFLAIESGWFTAEAGRQPWVVYNYLLTKQAASILQAENIIIAFVLIVIVYGIIFGFYYFKYLLKIIKQGPELDSTTSLPFGYLQEHN